jgi:DNA-binding IclR family transcriptional regulator
MSTRDDDRNSALKVLDVLEALSGYAVSGVSNTALSKSLNLHPSAITRAMGVLTEKGWARKDETSGFFHPTSRMGRVFGRVLEDIARTQAKIDEIKQNFTRNE